MQTLVKLVRFFESSQTARPIGHPAHLRPAHRKPARRLTAHLSKTVLGLGLVTVGFVFPLQRLLETSSVEAVVKVPTITLRAPIDGEVEASANPVDFGASVGRCCGLASQTAGPTARASMTSHARSNSSRMSGWALLPGLRPPARC